MATTSTTDNKPLLYLVGGLVALGAGILLLVFLYFSFSYLSLNLFLALDASLAGHLAAAPWPGYALLGLGLGAAAGAITAQRRFRLNKAIGAGALGLVVAVGALAMVGNPAHFASPAIVNEAGFYIRNAGQGQCPACASLAATSTRADAENRYTVARLLDKDPTTAWIAGADDGQELTMTLTIPADQRLVGLRLANGYGKSEEAFASFGRIHTCRIRLNGGPATEWTLPDSHAEDVFIPLTVPPGTVPSTVQVAVQETYTGTNHPEVALSGLTPVIEATQ